MMENRSFDHLLGGLKAVDPGGLSLRLGGFPLVIVSVAHGSEGRHFAFTMSTSLLGGGSRPSLH